jgi:hypothetical protein
MKAYEHWEQGRLYGALRHIQSRNRICSSICKREWALEIMINVGLGKRKEVEDLLLLAKQEPQFNIQLWSDYVRQHLSDSEEKSSHPERLVGQIYEWNSGLKPKEFHWTLAQAVSGLERKMSSTLQLGFPLSRSQFPYDLRNLWFRDNQMVVVVDGNNRLSIREPPRWKERFFAPSSLANPIKKLWPSHRPWSFYTSNKAHLEFWQINTAKLDLRNFKFPSEFDNWRETISGKYLVLSKEISDEPSKCHVAIWNLNQSLQPKLVFESKRLRPKDEKSPNCDLFDISDDDEWLLLPGESGYEIYNFITKAVVSLSDFPEGKIEDFSESNLFYTESVSSEPLPWRRFSPTGRFVVLPQGESLVLYDLKRERRRTLPLKEQDWDDCELTKPIYVTETSILVPNQNQEYLGCMVDFKKMKLLRIACPEPPHHGSRECAYRPMQWLINRRIVRFADLAPQDGKDEWNYLWFPQLPTQPPMFVNFAFGNPLAFPNSRMLVFSQWQSWFWLDSVGNRTNIRNELVPHFQKQSPTADRFRWLWGNLTPLNKFRVDMSDSSKKSSFQRYSSQGKAKYEETYDALKLWQTCSTHECAQAPPFLSRIEARFFGSTLKITYPKALIWDSSSNTLKQDPNLSCQQQTTKIFASSVFLRERGAVDSYYFRKNHEWFRCSPEENRIQPVPQMEQNLFRIYPESSKPNSGMTTHRDWLIHRNPTAMEFIHLPTMKRYTSHVKSKNIDISDQGLLAYEQAGHLALKWLTSTSKVSSPSLPLGKKDYFQFIQSGKKLVVVQAVSGGTNPTTRISVYDQLSMNVLVSAIVPVFIEHGTWIDYFAEEKLLAIHHQYFIEFYNASSGLLLFRLHAIADSNAVMLVSPRLNKEEFEWLGDSTYMDSLLHCHVGYNVLPMDVCYDKFHTQNLKAKMLQENQQKNSN